MDIERQLALLTADDPGTSFAARMDEIGLHPLAADGLAILQMNITRRCNLSCKHCHVEAGPLRSEEMDWEAMVQCLEIAVREHCFACTAGAGSSCQGALEEA